MSSLNLEPEPIDTEDECISYDVDEIPTKHQNPTVLGEGIFSNGGC